MFVLLVFAASCAGTRNYLVYGRLFPGMAEGEEEPAPDPTIEGAGSHPPEEPVPPPLQGDRSGSKSTGAGKFVSGGRRGLPDGFVTKQTTLGKYAPRDIVALPDEVCQTWKYYLREEAASHLVQLWEAAREEGIEIKVISAYRSYGYANEAFSGSCRRPW